MRPTKLLPATIASLALVLGLAACGGSSSPSSEKSTTTKAESSGSDDDATTTEADNGDDDTPTTVVATGGGDFCKDLADYINDSSMQDIDVTDPEAYKKAIEETTERGKELLSNAPEELDDSVEVLLDAQDQVIAALEKVDFDFSKVDPSAMNAMSSPEVEAAGAKLDAYVTDTCGIELPQTTAATVPDMTTMTAPN